MSQHAEQNRVDNCHRYNINLAGGLAAREPEVVFYCHINSPNEIYFIGA